MLSTPFDLDVFPERPRRGWNLKLLLWGPSREHSQLRATVTLTLHLSGFVCNVATLIFLAVFKQRHFFVPLMALWLFNGCFCAWCAGQETTRVLDGVHWCVRLPVLFVIYGLLQGVQVKHIIDLFHRRRATMYDSSGDVSLRATEEEPSTFHSKTFDGIIEGFPFAFVNLFTFYLLDGSTMRCPWYMRPALSGGHELLVRWLFFASAWLSILSLALGIVEVDYRVSTHVRSQIECSAIKAAGHLIFRATEVAYRMNMAILFVLFLRPLQIFNNRFGFVLVAAPVVLCWLLYLFLLVLAKPRSAPQEGILAHALVAITALVTNPTRFVDRPGYMSAARQFTKTIFVMRCIEFLCVLLYVVITWHHSFICGTDEPPEMVGTHVWKHQRIIFFVTAITFAIHSFLQLTCVQSQFSNEICDDTVLEMIPLPDQSAKVSGGVPRGMSSFLLQAGAGLTNRLFTKTENQFSDFVIERVLGCGAFGVVVLVRERSKAGEAMAPETQSRYAMKLQNTASRSGGSRLMVSKRELARRERDILRKVSHPFVVRLVYYFEVPDRTWKDACTGEVVKDLFGRDRFHTAIVMEYCPQGDLEKHIATRGTGRNSWSNNDLETDEFIVSWLLKMRRMAAEILVAFKFLHAERIAFRDLKPPNILLKVWADEQLHICLADFGGSKQLHETDNQLRSLTGTPHYCAPEIMEIHLSGRMSEYTPTVDIFSFGRVLLVMLWRSACPDNGELLHPYKEEYTNDPRVPLCAANLIQMVTNVDPRKRGSVEELIAHPFFGDFIHLDQQMHAIQWETLTEGCL